MQSVLSRHAQPAAVAGKSQPGDATRPVDVKAYLVRADSLKLAPQPFSPLRRVMHWPARRRIRRHTPMIAQPSHGRIGNSMGRKLVLRSFGVLAVCVVAVIVASAAAGVATASASQVAS
jgi:hypothetical protein